MLPNLLKAKPLIGLLGLEILLPNAEPQSAKPPLPRNPLHLRNQRPTYSRAMVPLVDVQPLQFDRSGNMRNARLDGSLGELDEADDRCLAGRVVRDDDVYSWVGEVGGDGGVAVSCGEVGLEI